MSTNLVKDSHGCHQISKQDGDTTESSRHFIAVNQRKRHNRRCKDSNSRCDLQQSASLQLRLISLETASDTIKNTNEGFFDASNFIDCFAESANKLSNTDCDGTERNAVQQVNNSTEVSFSQARSDCSTNAAKSIYNAAGNGLHSIPDSLENLHKLTISESFTNKLKSNNHSTLHISCCFSNLSHPSLHTLQKIVEQFKPRNLEVLSNSSNEVFNGCSRCFDEVYDTAENLVECIRRLNCFIKLDKPFAKGTSDTEKSTTKLANTPQKRTDSFNYSHKRTADNINDCEQSLESILEIGRRGFTQRESLSKITQTFCNFIELFRRHWREDFTECFLDRRDYTH